MRQVKALKIELWVLAERKIDTQDLVNYIKADICEYTETVLTVEASLKEEKTHVLFSEEEAQA
jgi:hypothetical protein